MVEKQGVFVVRAEEMAERFALVGRDPVVTSLLHGVNQKKVEETAGFVSHPNTHRLNLWLRSVIQGPHL